LLVVDSPPDGREPPPLCRAWIASISCPLGIRVVPVMPRPAAIDRSSGSTMADKPSPRGRRFAPLAEAGVVVSLMVSLTVILSGIQPIGRGLAAQWAEGCAPEKRAVLVVLVAGSLARAVVNGRRQRFGPGFAGGRSSGLCRVERANEAA
jgi:hypothetical protein